VVMSENPSNHVFVDCKVEGQGDLFSDSRYWIRSVKPSTCATHVTMN
jgi:hypothetical protein